ncbi:LEA type 2 family protein [bacterium]|nr:LEA type 2 family protein [bacterium]
MLKKEILIAITLLTLLLVSCSMLNQVQSRLAIKNCQFRIVSVRDITYNPLQDPDLIGFTINMDCRNPNESIETILDKLSFDLYINEEKTTSAIINDQIKIGPSKTVAIPVGVKVSIAEASSSIFQAIVDREANYKIKGNAYFSTPIGELSFPVTIKEGTWSI